MAYHYKVTATGIDKDNKEETVAYFTEKFHAAENLKYALETSFHMKLVTIEEKEGKL